MQRSFRSWWVLVRCALLLAIPLGAFAQAQAPSIALKGYDPVAYFTQGKPVKGVQSMSHEFDDVRYQFSSAKNKAAFVADPDKYAPQFTGMCSGGVSKGMKTESNPELWAIVNGKLYTFSSQKAKETVLESPALIAQAHKNWVTMK